MDMPRAVGVFRKAGFQVLPYPVDYTTSEGETLDFVPTVVRNLARLDHAAHEWLGLLGYRILGCTGVLFPGPRACEAPQPKDGRLPRGVS